ncbi:MAG: hypothetical protein Q8K58_07055 [Acidimicrobiales bacterium]|nr:hypothetical protein [Acidimicrobiales bacterium]
MAGAVGVVAVVAGEPQERLERLGEALALQVRAELVVRVAAPVEDHARIRSAIRPEGAIRSVVVMANPTGHRSVGLNLALRGLSTELVCRVDARSRPGADHVARCVSRLTADPTIGVVGGHQVPVPGEGRVVARSIARVLADPVVAGGAAYRRRSSSGDVDTVYLGAFRTAELVAVGGWADDLASNEDFELCQRYLAAGQRVWLEARLDVDYESRVRVRDLWAQYAAFGSAKVRYWQRDGFRPAPRQLVGLAGPWLGLLAAVGLGVWHPGLAGAGALLACAVLLAADARRPGTAGLGVRLTAALLTPVPAMAFAGGALPALVRS